MAEDNQKKLPTTSPTLISYTSEVSTKNFEVMDKLTVLESQAILLADTLDALRHRCGHEATSTDIADIVIELKLLGAELKTLDHAIGLNKAGYTEAFCDDLGEICVQLKRIFEDVDECCKEMQKTDGPKTGTVSWLHKKRYMRKLQKHLEANKTTLIVMRTVLHHGKEYGTQNSPGRLAEAAPRTLQEDLAILQAVFASRNAIKDLDDLAKATHKHNSSSVSSTASTDPKLSFQPGAHGRNISSATGIDTPVVEDVLPAATEAGKGLVGPLSRPRMRLAAYDTIMDTNPHTIPLSLRKKWIVKRHFNGVLNPVGAENQPFPPLDVISEKSGCSQSGGMDISTPGPERKAGTPKDSGENEGSRGSSERPSSSDTNSESRKKSRSLIPSPFKFKFGKSTTPMSRAAPHRKKTIDSSSNETKDSEQHEVNEESLSAKEKSGWSYRLTRPFVKSELTTPELEKDVDRMALR